MEPKREKKRRLKRPSRLLDFLWLVIPAITLISVAAYFIGALVLRVNPPALAIANQSMNSAIQQGDLAIIRGVDTRTLQPGEIIAVKLTGPEQAKYGLPSEIVRRIVKISRNNGTELFLTKGDGNPANDPFSVTPSAISGRVVGSVPFLGFPILFFSSKQGIIFLIATAIILLIYYILGFLEDRRHYAHATSATMQHVLEMVGHVHDAVQVNKTISPKKLAFPGVEFHKSAQKLELDLKELFPQIDQGGDRPLDVEPTALQHGLSNELKALVEQSIMHRRMVEWLLTGPVNDEVVVELLNGSINAIERLVAATQDQDLISLLQNSKLAPLLPAPNAPPPSGFPDAEDMARSFMDATRKYRRAAGLGQSDPNSTPANTPSVYEEVAVQAHEQPTIAPRRAPIDDGLQGDELLAEPPQFDFFAGPDRTLEGEDNVFINGEASQEQSQVHPASNPRHRRRSMRWRD